VTPASRGAGGGFGWPAASGGGREGGGMPPRALVVGASAAPTRAEVGPLPVTRALTVPLALSLRVAALLLVTSTAGLLFGRSGLYGAEPTTLPAFLGQDALSLLVGLPLLLGSLLATRRGSLRGLLLWLGSLFYVAYGYAFYVLSPEFNVLYPAYLTIVSASGYALLYLLLGVDAEAVRARFSARTPTRLAAGFLMAIPLLLGSAWLSMIVSALASGAAPTRVQLVVWPLDLVVAFPALFWGGVWLWRRQALGYVVAGLLLLKGGFYGLTLVVATWLATLWGVPPDPMLPVYALGGLGGAALMVLYLRGVGPTAEYRAEPAVSTVSPRPGGG
jgi:hypothetical protein